MNWKNKQTPISKRNNKDLDSLKTKDTRSKPFELKCQELKSFLELFPAMESYYPKKDQCEISQEDYLEHQSKKKEARAEKEKVKAKENAVFKVDLLAVLMASKSKMISLYYKTKLQIHNLAFYNKISKLRYTEMGRKAISEATK